MPIKFVGAVAEYFDI